jgi:DNA-binding NtrC family response regulator
MRRLFSLPQLLVIAHHPGLSSLMASQLLGEGYRVKTTTTLEEAVGMLRNPRFRPALLVLDTLHQRLTLDALNDLPTKSSLLVCTGPLDPGGPLFIQRPRTTILQKPFTLRELVDAVYGICYKGL